MSIYMTYIYVIFLLINKMDLLNLGEFRQMPKFLLGCGGIEIKVHEGNAPKHIPHF